MYAGLRASSSRRFVPRFLRLIKGSTKVLKWLRNSVVTFSILLLGSIVLLPTVAQACDESGSTPHQTASRSPDPPAASPTPSIPKSHLLDSKAADPPPGSRDPVFRGFEPVNVPLAVTPFPVVTVMVPPGTYSVTATATASTASMEEVVCDIRLSPPGVPGTAGTRVGAFNSVSLVPNPGFGTRQSIATTEAVTAPMGGTSIISYSCAKELTTTTEVFILAGAAITAVGPA